MADCGRSVKASVDRLISGRLSTLQMGAQMTHNPEASLAAAPPSRLAHEAVVTADRPHPRAELGAVAACASTVVLAGRATHVL
jgi:hypothetical protein